MEENIHNVSDILKNANEQIKKGLLASEGLVNGRALKDTQLVEDGKMGDLEFGHQNCIPSCWRICP